MYLKIILLKPLGHVCTSDRLQQPSAKYKSLVAHVKFLWLLQVVKQIWAYIKKHDLQNPQDRRKINPDEVLGTFLTAPVNMMSMNSQLSKHCFTKGTHTLLIVPFVDYICTSTPDVNVPRQITCDVPHFTYMYINQTDRWTKTRHKTCMAEQMQCVVHCCRQV